MMANAAGPGKVYGIVMYLYCTNSVAGGSPHERVWTVWNERHRQEIRTAADSNWSLGWVGSDGVWSI